jgi:hypothetical protein
MSVRTKGRAKFDFHGRQFVWYVAEDRYLRIASADKKYCVSYAWDYPGNLKVYGTEFPGLDASERRRGIAWLDTGTYSSLLSSSQFVQTLEERQGLKVACIEEIAFAKKFIDGQQLKKLADECGKSEYGEYLRRVLKDAGH